MNGCSHGVVEDVAIDNRRVLDLPFHISTKGAHLMNSSSKHSLAIILFVLAAAGFSNRVSADLYKLDATDAGFVTLAGGSSKGDGTIFAPATYNYSVGQELHYFDGSLGVPPGTTPLAYMDRNNYFVFDLSSVSGTIISASLVMPTGLFESVDPTEAFHLLSPTDPGAALSDAEMLLTGNSVGTSEFDEPTDPLVGVAAALYGNIEGGVADILATAVISSADDFTTLTIPISPAGIDYLALFGGGPVIFGGSVSTITPGATTQQPFGGVAPGIPGSPPGSDPSIPMLMIETAAVPEPSTFLVSAFALLGFAGIRRRRD